MLEWYNRIKYDNEITGVKTLSYILLYELGQTFSSWIEIIQKLNEEWNIFCSNLSDWILGKQPCYDMLYKAFWLAPKDTLELADRRRKNRGDSRGKDCNM